MDVFLIRIVRQRDLLRPLRHFPIRILSADRLRVAIPEHHPQEGDKNDAGEQQNRQAQELLRSNARSEAIASDAKHCADKHNVRQIQTSGADRIYHQQGREDTYGSPRE